MAACDVLVVGAGPTGLLAAGLLARSGVAVRIIDKSPGPAKESRAFAVQARTLEILLSIGLADAFLDRGVVASGARVFVDGRQAADIAFDDIGRRDTPYPFVLLLPQSETEAILLADLDRFGIVVERGLEATGLTQDAAGVTVEARDGEGAAHAIPARYVIGADGAHSVVRKALGLSFEGAPYPQSFLLADCRVEWPLDHGRLMMFLRGSSFAMHFPLKGRERARIIALDEPAPGADPALAAQGSSPVDLSEVEAALRRATQVDLRLSEPVWTSRYRVHHRGVDRYRVGRAFVAGDAAHIHSPAGGQGMNTGLQDAANLAWRLALVLAAGAAETLLDGYHDERLPVGQDVLAYTDRAFSVATSQSGWVTGLRDRLVPALGATISRSGFVRARAFHFISQLGVRYAPPAGADAEAGRWTGGPAPGRRAPDAVVDRRTSVFDLLAGYRFNLLAFSRRALDVEEIAAVAQALAGLRARAPFDLGTRLVAHSLIGRDPRLTQAESGQALEPYGLSLDAPDALYLVRPDGYVAWRAAGFDFDACGAFVASALAPAPA